MLCLCDCVELACLIVCLCCVRVCVLVCVLCACLCSEQYDFFNLIYIQ